MHLGRDQDLTSGLSDYTVVYPESYTHPEPHKVSISENKVLQDVLGQNEVMPIRVGLTSGDWCPC